MAKRKGKKKAAKSARRPKAAKKAKKTARRAARKPARRAQARSAARRPMKKKAAPKRKAARKAVTRKPARRAAKPAPRAAKPAFKAAKPVKKAAAAAAPKKLPNLDRERKRLADTDIVPSAPSTLSYQGGASAARSGRSEMRDSMAKHTETGPALTGGDVDADWEDAYAVGDEAPGGDNPTPDQDRVDDIGKALGVQYEDNEELKGAEKIQDRDRHRWELDPASSDDYVDRKREED